MPPSYRRVPALIAALTTAWALAGAPAATAATGEPAGPPEVVGFYASSPSDPAAATATYLEMMATPSLYTGFKPVVPAPGADDAAACPPSRCHDYRVPLPAGVHVSSNRVRVLLPAGYHHSQRRYPVIYLYSGGEGDYTDWSRNSRITAISKHLPAIFVLPDGGAGRHIGMFSDWLDGSAQWETFHTGVVIPWVDQHFRTVRGDRAAVGQSIAALGAVGYAARHRGLFRAVLSLSGLVDIHLLTGDVLPAQVSALTGSLPPDMTKVWGDPVTHASTWTAHDPAALASRLEGVSLFISAGTGYVTGDPDDPIHSGFLENLLWQGGERTFLGALTAAGVPFRARIARGDSHGWPWFDRPLRWGLAGIMKVLG